MQPVWGKQETIYIGAGNGVMIDGGQRPKSATKQRKKIRRFESTAGHGITCTTDGLEKCDHSQTYYTSTHEHMTCGIYDGHGGVECAKFASQELGENFLSEMISMEESPDDLSSKNAQNLADCSRKIHSAIDKAFSESDQSDDSGCTALTLAGTDSLVWVSAVGDVRCVLCRRGTALPLTYDHTPFAPREQARISAASVSAASTYKMKKDGDKTNNTASRSFGDFAHKQIEGLADIEQPVISTPDVTVLDLCDDDEFIVVASAIIWKHLSEVQVVEAVKSSLECDDGIERVVSDLCDKAVSAIVSKDQCNQRNISIIIWIPKLSNSSDDTISTVHTTNTDLLSKWKALVDKGLIPDGIYRPITNGKHGSFGRKSFMNSKHQSPIGSPTGKCAQQVVIEMSDFNTPVYQRPVGLNRVPLLLVLFVSCLWLVWEVVRNAYYLTIPHVMLVSTCLFLIIKRKELCNNSLQLPIVFCGVLYVVLLDALGGLSFDGWSLSGTIVILLAMFSTKGTPIVFTGIFLSLWIIIRTLEEGKHVGLFNILPTAELPFDADARNFPKKGGEWIIGVLLSRLVSVLSLTTLAVNINILSSNGRDRLVAAFNCTQVVSNAIISRDYSVFDPKALDALMMYSDPTGGLRSSLLGILKNLATNNIKKHEKGDESSRCPTSEAPSTLEGLSSVYSCDIDYDLSSHWLSAKCKNVSITCARLAHETDFTQIATFVDIANTAITASDGTILYLGGSVITISWNSHSPVANHVHQALSCCISMQAHLLGLSQCNIALVTGQVSCGSLNDGCQVTVGKCITYAQQLAILARTIRAKTVLTDKVYEQVRSVIFARPIDAVSVTASDKPELIYEVQGSRNDASPPKTCSLIFTEAFSSLHQLKLEQAKSQFLKCLQSCPRDNQAKRLLSITEWLMESDCSYLLDEKQYSRRLYSDVEFYCLGLSDEKHDEKTELKLDYDPLGKRESLQHDKVLRRQIRDAEAEANAEQLEAWGIVADSGKKATAGSQKKEFEVPTRFQDHKGRTWCRAGRSLGKGAFGEVWLGMGAEGSLVALKSMRLPTFTNTNENQNLSAAARRRLARKGGGGGGARTDLQLIEDLLREVGLMHKLRHENIVCCYLNLLSL